MGKALGKTLGPSAFASPWVTHWSALSIHLLGSPWVIRWVLLRKSKSKDGRQFDLRQVCARQIDCKHIENGITLHSTAVCAVALRCHLLG